MRNAGLEEAQAGIKIAWRNINKLRYADDTTLMAESEEELKKKPLDKSESEVPQSCPTLATPWTDCIQPTRLLRPWDFLGKSTLISHLN